MQLKSLLNGQAGRHKMDLGLDCVLETNRGNQSFLVTP